VCSSDCDFSTAVLDQITTGSRSLSERFQQHRAVSSPSQASFVQSCCPVDNDRDDGRARLEAPSRTALHAHCHQLSCNGPVSVRQHAASFIISAAADRLRFMLPAGR
jgi:hypothetical protein